MSIELVIAIIAGICVPVVVGWTGRLQSRLSDVEKELNDFKVKTAEHYVPKEDLREFDKKLGERLGRIEEKLDNLIKINGKT